VRAIGPVLVAGREAACRSTTGLWTYTRMPTLALRLLAKLVRPAIED
jgi:hypothetical protein